MAITNSTFLRLSTLIWLLIILILVVLPHLFHLTWWILPTFFILLLWRYLIFQQQQFTLSPTLQFSLALLVLLGIFLSYGTWFGRDAGIAFLIVLCGLKLLEMNSRRDAFLLVFLSYFLVITHFLYSQAIFTVIYLGIVTWLITATLISLSDNNDKLLTVQRLRLSATLLVQALPLMAVSFFLFPRLTGTIWSLPKDAYSGVTGLSDSISLGQVSKLSLSNNIAFRVKFHGNIPSPNYLYWRGPVLWWTNGRDWQSGFQYGNKINNLDIHPIGEAINYTVTLEPHNQRWLFALDLPAKAPLQGYLNRDYQVLANHLVHQRLIYQLSSYTRYRADILTNQQHRLGLSLPPGKHLRARALAQQWLLSPHSQQQAIVQRALQYFNQQPFVYTHTPPFLTADPIDEFLFETRQGFCEHYAAAFTVLMRAAGIPARIVTGYLGGIINPVGHYLIVRQRDAHAWSEIWLPDQGWVRVDPTAAIAPERIEAGIDIALPEQENLLDVLLTENSIFNRVWQNLSYRWDVINNTWNQWIVDYNSLRQQHLISQLGLKNLDWRGMTIFLVFTMTILFLLVTWILLRPTIKVKDPAQQIYQRFCKKLARRGLQRHLSEGPLTFANRISTIRPDLALATHQVIALYLQTRYRSQSQTLEQLRLAVQKFHP